MKVINTRQTSKLLILTIVSSGGYLQYIGGIYASMQFPMKTPAETHIRL